MRVAIVSDSLPGYHRVWSGAEVIALTLAQMLEENGCGVFFITPPFDVPDANGRFEVHEVRTPLRRLGTFSRNFVSDIGAIKSLYRVLKNKRPDVVHINAKYLFLPAVIACSRLKIPAVFTVPDYFIFCPTTFIRKPDGSSCTRYHGAHCYECISVLGDGLARRAAGMMPNGVTRALLKLRAREFDYFLKKLSAFVVLSEASKERLVGYGIPEEKVNVIYHYRMAEPVETKQEIKNPSAVFVGWLSEENGVDVLIRAFIMACKKVDGAMLYLVGTGKESFINRMKREIAEAGLSGRVEFLGKRENPEALSIVSKCDTTVVAHQWPKEFGPVILIEALALGKPVITSLIGATKEFVEDGVNGFLVSDYRSPEAFANRLVSLLSNTALAREMGGRVSSKMAFLKDGSAPRKAKELYRTLMTGKKAVG